MAVIDLGSTRDAGPRQLAECDVCIVGSGPAGATLARALSGSGLQVTLLESGGYERTAHADALNAVENIGHAREEDQWEVRNRIVGGSSHTWGGRCAPFDEIDFEPRPWVPFSGWPFSREALVPYFEQSAPYLGLAAGDGFTDEGFWRLGGRQMAPEQPDPAKLRPFFWQFSRDDANPHDYMRFGPRLADQIGANVTLATSATVVEIIPHPGGGAVKAVDFTGPGGQRRRLAARAVVLCAGGIENARLLLASTASNPRGLGNAHDQVGRYLMDHPRGQVGLFRASDASRLQRRFGRHRVQGRLFRAGFRLSPEIQRAEGLLNCSAWLGETPAADDPWEAIKRLIRRHPELPGDVIAIARNLDIVCSGLGSYFGGGQGVARKLSALSLDVMTEQRPDPNSRITLSDLTDRFGNRLPKIDWRVHPDEIRTVRRTAELVAEQFEQMRLPAPQLADWVREGESFPPGTFLDVAHPTGTTRMAQDPSLGVVDVNCRVHSVEGLYVAGSSVFPTAGHCNPTQMIVALSLRLADHLKARAREATTPHREKAMKAESRRTRVLVTGATGRIGSVVVSQLLERGYGVRATTSKSPPPAAHPALEWRQVDLHEPAPHDDLVAGCEAVLHIAAEMHQPERMWRSNVDATARLAEAAERAGVRAFCYTSSVAVYGSGLKAAVSEDSPVLTIDEDVKNEYWGNDAIRVYGRTKLGGERAIRQAAKSVRYTIFRPAVVVGIPEIIEIGDWSRAKRTITAHRHAHHIYVGDVADAIIWGMERGLAGLRPEGSIELYNLAEDEIAEPTHAQFLRKAYAASGDARFQVRALPPAVDWLRDFLRFRRLPLRNPLWRMRFSNKRLLDAGYRFPTGMAKAQAMALERLTGKTAGAATEPATAEAASPKLAAPAEATASA